MERIPSARATGRGMTVMAFEEMDSSDRNRCGSSTSRSGSYIYTEFRTGYHTTCLFAICQVGLVHCNEGLLVLANLYVLSFLTASGKAQDSRSLGGSPADRRWRRALCLPLQYLSFLADTN